MVTSVAPLLVKYGVQVYLNGHKHNLEHITWNGVEYITNGHGGGVTGGISTSPCSISAACTGQKFAQEIGGFATFSVTATTFTFSFISETGTNLYSATFTNPKTEFGALSPTNAPVAPLLTTAPSTVAPTSPTRKPTNPIPTYKPTNPNPTYKPTNPNPIPTYKPTNGNPTRKPTNPIPTRKPTNPFPTTKPTNPPSKAPASFGGGYSSMPSKKPSTKGHKHHRKPTKKPTKKPHRAH